MERPSASSMGAVVLLSLLAPAVALAGTLCGSVTERQNNTPIAHAGVFLRTPAGRYTGIYGATDATGAFCISNVPAGTYDIEVRVDDEQVAYLRGVVVNVTTDVAIDATPPGLRLAAPSPNPARDVTHLSWTLPRTSRVRLAIYDVRGRFVRGWSAQALPAGEHTLDWDLRDVAGHPLAAGIYFIRLDAGAVHLTRTVVRTW